MRDLENEHRRLTILRHLEKSARYTSNATILTDVANGVGVPSSRDQIAAALSWLESHGLVTCSASNGFVVAAATSLGCEVALGQFVHPGVKRPSTGG
jgi:hypothetical protein